MILEQGLKVSGEHALELPHGLVHGLSNARKALACTNELGLAAAQSRPEGIAPLLVLR
jgi:hypothetical protein